jgi:predicted RNA-binding protein with PUA-like domain
MNKTKFALNWQLPRANAMVFGSSALLAEIVFAIVRAMAKNYWLVKQEPDAYSWTDFVNDGKTAWTGVRNFQARNNLRSMRRGDSVLFYHSVSEKSVVGLAKVEREAYPDPTAKEGDWSCVDLVPVKALKKPVSLEAVKADEMLAKMPLVRQSRLSVTPLTQPQFDQILGLSGTK